MKDFHFKTKCNDKYIGYLWNDVEKPKAIMQIVHGANEHCLRYDEFARFLNRNGIIVYGIDHLGHGRHNLDGKNVVTFKNTKGHIDVIDAQLELSDFIRKENNDLPLIIFGHSMGSFIVRYILGLNSEKYEYAIISGTSYVKSFKANIIYLLTWIIKRIYGPNHFSKLIHNLTFKSLTKKLLKDGVISESIGWLTTDKDKIEEAKQDKYLSNVFSISTQKDMFYWIKRINNLNFIKNIDSNLPILLLSGGADPMNKGSVKKLASILKSVGIKNVKCRIYPDGRHEMLNEVNREEVYSNILDWLDIK